jgi:hypothetical protein
MVQHCLGRGTGREGREGRERREGEKKSEKSNVHEEKEKCIKSGILGIECKLLQPLSKYSLLTAHAHRVTHEHAQYVIN